MTALPSLSIIVPNYNGGATIAATLQSLLDQQYPRLEIIVIDGGSTDNSTSVIRQFEKHLAYWISEKDRGQSDAINKGFARSTGEIVNWLCSDDLLAPAALQTVGSYFHDHPACDVLVGKCRIIHKKWEYIQSPTPTKISLMPCDNPIGQPSCFYRKKLLNRPGPLRPDLHYVMDFELWMHFKNSGAQWDCIDQVLSIYPLHGANKMWTGGSKIRGELEKVYLEYVKDERIPLVYWQKTLRFPLEMWTKKLRSSPLRRLPLLASWTLDGLLALFYGRQRVKAMTWGFTHNDS